MAVIDAEELKFLEEKIDSYINIMKKTRQSLSYDGRVLRIKENGKVIDEVLIDTPEKQKALDLYLRMHKELGDIIYYIFGMREKFIKTKNLQGLEKFVVEFADVVSLWRQIPNVMRESYAKKFEIDLETIRINYILLRKHFNSFRDGRYIQHEVQEYLFN